MALFLGVWNVLFNVYPVAMQPRRRDESTKMKAEVDAMEVAPWPRT
jgi:hypothetical protein